MIHEMAVPAESLRNQSSGLPDLLATREDLELHVARLVGQGHTLKQIARAFSMRLSPDAKDPVQSAYQKLRRWSREQWFRDLVYENAVIKLDLAIPGILNGVASKARRGRVDAARLALEITGRHVTKGEVAPPNIAIIVSGMPRPEGSPAVAGEIEA